MNAKLRRASDGDFEAIAAGAIKKEVLHKLYEIIGVQRDHYQHLSKPLKYDLSKSSEEFVAVNAMLAAMIRLHFLKFIGLPGESISVIIRVQLSWVKIPLNRLASAISRQYPE